MYKMRYETNSRSVEASEESRERERERERELSRDSTLFTNSIILNTFLTCTNDDGEECNSLKKKDIGRFKYYLIIK